ncbi:MAG: four-carbon acid sugar kinase family protein [Acidobacteriaceae bacterium]|nr:four-carbon acid sugar kinase family protein [Acidobacteriaceae bacterium]
MASDQQTPIFTFYGDDFTGSTDALEALAINGVASVLFFKLPDDAMLRQFGHCQAIGVAGESRSRSPEWMCATLPAVFRRLKEIGGQICQYKVCSTFDSSPQIGSIGRALDIGAEVFESEFVPVFAAAPRLKRYVAFANLFAAAGQCVYRIDRHPTMSRHPVTPMRESDLRLHLGNQTTRSLRSFDIRSLEAQDAGARLDALLREHPHGVLFDGMSEQSVEKSSALVWARRRRAPFVIASSGFTHGLASHWRSMGLLSATATPSQATRTDRLIVFSGSCSPVTESQIRWSLANGFTGFRIDPALIGPAAAATMDAALTALQAGRSVVIYTALGPSECVDAAGGEPLGSELGRLLRDLLLRSGVRRAIIAGGDTSSHAGQQLGIYALTVRGPLTPGAPLCEAHSHDPNLRGLELVLKGGQVGGEDFFRSVLEGKPG